MKKSPTQSWDSLQRQGPAKKSHHPLLYISDQPIQETDGFLYFPILFTIKKTTATSAFPKKVYVGDAL